MYPDVDTPASPLIVLLLMRNPPMPARVHPATPFVPTWPHAYHRPLSHLPYSHPTDRKCFQLFYDSHPTWPQSCPRRQSARALTQLPHRIAMAHHRGQVLPGLDPRRRRRRPHPIVQRNVLTVVTPPRSGEGVWNGPIALNYGRWVARTHRGSCHLLTR